MSYHYLVLTPIVSIVLVNHPNKEKFAYQKILIIKIEEYVIAVPFVENDSERFLKTIIPSRKLPKQYLGALK